MRRAQKRTAAAKRAAQSEVRSVKGMDIESGRVISLSATDRSFSEIARLVDLYGSAVVALNNKPRYLVLDLNLANGIEAASNQEVQEISRRLINRNRAVYQELAK